MSECPNCNKPYQAGDEVCRHCGFILPFSSNLLEPGKILHDRYEIESLIHSGGMGYIYLAKDKNLYNRICVVKQIKEPVRSDEDRQKLEQESLRMSMLNHPGAAMVLDQFTEGGYYFLVVQHIAGKTLNEVFDEKEEELSEAGVMRWAISICDVVSYIHGKGVIHRDISPENIMLTNEGSIMFIDFGTMRELRNISGTKTAGIGKFGFTPPEQWQGKPVVQSDVFAIGVTIYYLLTGHLPLSEKYKKTQSPQPQDFRPEYVPIRQIRSDISEGLEHILLKALSLDVKQRYSSVEEMGQDLRAIYGHDSSRYAAPAKKKPQAYATAASGQDGHVPHGQRRRNWIIAVAAGILIVLASLIITSIDTRTPYKSLTVSAPPISFTDVLPGLFHIDHPETIMISNTGKKPVSYALTSNKAWLKVPEIENLLEQDNEQKLNIWANSEGLEYGFSDTGLITIAAKGGEHTVPVSLSLTDIIFQDDFSSPDSGWDEEKTNIAFSGYTEGGFHITVNEPGWGTLRTNKFMGDIADFTVEAEAQWLSSNISGAYGLVFRLADGDNFYEFIIETKYGEYRFLKQINDENIYLTNWTKSPYVNKGMEKNILKVSCRGNQITLYINGQMVETIKDATFNSGTIGPIVRNFDKSSDSDTDTQTEGEQQTNLKVQALFDNLIVRCIK